MMEIANVHAHRIISDDFFSLGFKTLRKLQYIRQMSHRIMYSEVERAY
jgi:hypothetical protein